MLKFPGSLYKFLIADPTGWGSDHAFLERLRMEVLPVVIWFPSAQTSSLASTPNIRVDQQEQEQASTSH